MTFSLRETVVRDLYRKKVAKINSSPLNSFNPLLFYLSLRKGNIMYLG
jgi:hypothetical protein